MNEIQRYFPAIIKLCQKHMVKSMSVFGSVLTSKFNEKSDIDLLVRFEDFDKDKYDYVDNYFGLKDSLENIFSRKVDLIEEKGLRNKYFIEEINKTRLSIYGE